MGAQRKIAELEFKLKAAKDFAEVCEQEYEKVRLLCHDMTDLNKLLVDRFDKLQSIVILDMVDYVNYMWGDSYNEWIAESLPDNPYLLPYWRI